MDFQYHYGHIAHKMNLDGPSCTKLSLGSKIRVEIMIFAIFISQQLVSIEINCQEINWIKKAITYQNIFPIERLGCTWWSTATLLLLSKEFYKVVTIQKELDDEVNSLRWTKKVEQIEIKINGKSLEFCANLRKEDNKKSFYRILLNQISLYSNNSRYMWPRQIKHRVFLWIHLKQVDMNCFEWEEWYLLWIL